MSILASLSLLSAKSSRREHFAWRLRTFYPPTVRSSLCQHHQSSKVRRVWPSKESSLNGMGRSELSSSPGTKALAQTVIATAALPLPHPCEPAGWLFVRAAVGSFFGQCHEYQ